MQANKHSCHVRFIYLFSHVYCILLRVLVLVPSKTKRVLYHAFVQAKTYSNSVVLTRQSTRRVHPSQTLQT